MDNPAENQDEKIARQTEVVNKLYAEYRRQPSDELKLKIDRAGDVLCHLIASADGNAAERARYVAATAENIAVGKAIGSVTD